MSRPARLTSSLLARKGEALPAGGRAQADIGSPPPWPAVMPGARTSRRADNVRRLEAAATRATGASDQPKAGRKGRVALTVRLDPARHARLKILAARQQRTSQAVMIDALDALLEACGGACECMRSGAGYNTHH